MKKPRRHPSLSPKLAVRSEPWFLAFLMFVEPCSRLNSFVQWTKVAANAVDLQKASDAGKNLQAEEVKKELRAQTEAFREIKKSLRAANIEIGNFY